MLTFWGTVKTVYDPVVEGGRRIGPPFVCLDAEPVQIIWQVGAILAGDAARLAARAARQVNDVSVFAHVSLLLTSTHVECVAAPWVGVSRCSVSTLAQPPSSTPSGPGWYHVPW